MNLNVLGLKISEIDSSNTGIYTVMYVTFAPPQNGGLCIFISKQLLPSSSFYLLKKSGRSPFWQVSWHVSPQVSPVLSTVLSPFYTKKFRWISEMMTAAV